MKRLILFDIDGTLLRGPDNPARVEVIHRRYGIEVEPSKHRLGGMTEPEILTLLLKSAEWDDNKIKRELPGLIEELSAHYLKTHKGGTFTILPGVKTLFDTLSRTDAILGLITGNIKSRAQTKLEDVGIWTYFTVGGYGDDPHESRSDLVTIAAERAGFRLNEPGVFVIGDTWRDMKAAADAGVINRIGLFSGRHPKEELEEGGATAVLADLVDTERVMRIFGFT